MTYDQAVAIHDKPRIKSVNRLRAAAARIVERGKESDWTMAFRLNARGKIRERLAKITPPSTSRRR